MKRKIKFIEKPPFINRYMLELECGHTVWRNRRPTTNEIRCYICAHKKQKEKCGHIRVGEGRGVMVKMIRIEGCDQCFYYDKPYCCCCHSKSFGRKTGSYMYQAKVEIPSWCPLPDAPEKGEEG